MDFFFFSFLEWGVEGNDWGGGKGMRGDVCKGNCEGNRTLGGKRL